jgi:hypothetical protein
VAKPVNHRLPVLLRSQYDAPETYGHCIAGTEETGSFTQRAYGQRRCEAGKCRHNIDVKRSEERPGRRYKGRAPEWTMNGGSMSASGPSCALDVAKLHPEGLSATDVGSVLGLSKRRVEQVIKKWRVEQGAADLIELTSEDDE